MKSYFYFIQSNHLFDCHDLVISVQPLRRFSHVRSFKEIDALTQTSFIQKINYIPCIVVPLPP